MTQENGEVERIARAFHAASEELLPEYGTRRNSARPWGRVSKSHRELLEATVRLMLKWDVIRPGRRRGP